MSGFHPSLSYPASDATYGETETFVSSQTEGESHYELAEMILNPINCLNQENGSGQDVSTFELPVTLRNPDSSIPKNRTEFILNLDQTEIDHILDPINRQILSADTVFSLRDARCGLSLAICGQEIFEILESNGRQVNLESPYENENVDYNLDKISRRRRFAILCLISSLILIAIVIALIVTLVILKPWKTEPSVFPIINGNLPVIVVFGGTMLLSDGVTKKALALDTIEVYYPHNSSKSRLLQIFMLTPLIYHVSGRLGENVIIAGGSTSDIVSNQSALSSVEIFNLINGSVTFGPSMLYKRALAAAATYGNAFFVCGGANLYEPFTNGFDSDEPDMLVSKQCEVLYNIHSKWQLMAPMNNYRPLFNSLLIIEHFACVIGPPFISSSSEWFETNISAENYGPLELNGFNKTLEWFPTTDFFHPAIPGRALFSPSASFCNTSVISCITGIEGVEDYNPYTKTNCMSYSEKKKEWLNITTFDPAIAGGYTFATVNTLSHGCAIYALGGVYVELNLGNRTILDAVSILTSDKDCRSDLCWITGPKLKQARAFSSAIVIS